ncbi:MAG: FkbM family methyltransferase [Fimbriimonadaceae bacterium]
MIDSMRSMIRSAGLASRLSPFLARYEKWRLARFGKLEQRSLSKEVSELVSASSDVFRVGPPAHYADMAVSVHELPSLVASLNVCAPVMRNGVVWDVGGNAGFYSHLFGLIAGPKGRVFAFEPVPTTFQMMCANLEAAGAKNVTPLNLALSDQCGVLPISFDPNSDTTSSLENTQGMTCVNVRVATGDNLVEVGECLQPTMLKIDIEGHELKALEGMRQIMAQPQCRAVICEIHFSILASHGEHQPGVRARKMLREAGFDRVIFISRSHLLATKGRF